MTLKESKCFLGVKEKREKPAAEEQTRGEIFLSRIRLGGREFNVEAKEPSTNEDEKRSD